MDQDYLRQSVDYFQSTAPMAACFNVNQLEHELYESQITHNYMQHSTDQYYSLGINQDNRFSDGVASAPAPYNYNIQKDQAAAKSLSNYNDAGAAISKLPVKGANMLDKQTVIDESGPASPLTPEYNNSSGCSCRRCSFRSAKHSPSSNYNSPRGNYSSIINHSPTSNYDSPLSTGSAGHRSAPQLAGRADLATLPDFPSDLADPARLLLVSCLDPETAHFYSCPHCSAKSSSSSKSSSNSTYNSTTVWVINFYHRHAFCAACGQPPTATWMPAKHFAQLFIAAASRYVSCSVDQQIISGTGRSSTDNYSSNVDGDSNWWIRSDSTCSLRFLRATGADACSLCCCRRSSNYDDIEHSAMTSCIWAANYVYSYAFCTGCGGSAEGPTLLSLLLAIRYGRQQTKTRFSPKHHHQYAGHSPHHRDKLLPAQKLVNGPDDILQVDGAELATRERQTTQKSGAIKLF